MTSEDYVKQELDFVTSLSDAAGVPYSYVAQFSFASMVYRRLLAEGIRISVGIGAANETAAHTIAGRLTADRINFELNKIGLPAATVLVAAFVVPAPPPLSPICQLAPVDLGDAAGFAVLAKTSVTATGSHIYGDMGTFPGVALPPYALYTPGTAKLRHGKRSK